MGADVYRQSITKPAHEKWYPIFQEAAKKRDEFSKQKKEQELILAHLATADEEVKLTGLIADLATQIDAAQGEVEEAYDNMYPDLGYLRDSYNPSSFLWTIDMSWWRDISPKLNKKGFLSVTNIKWFKKEIETREMSNLPVWEDETPEETLAYFQTRRQYFLDFLQGAIDAKEAIYCSL